MSSLRLFGLIFAVLGALSVVAWLWQPASAPSGKTPLVWVSDNNPARTLQIATFEQVLAKKPAGIFVHPMNADAFIEPINKAIDSGVAIATFAADSPKSKRRLVRSFCSLGGISRWVKKGENWISCSSAPKPFGKWMTFAYR